MKYAEGEKVVVIGPSKIPRRCSWTGAMDPAKNLTGKVTNRRIAAEPPGERYFVHIKTKCGTRDLWFWDDEISPIVVRCRL